ncbi:hypothetical protein B4143_0320 [Bacillus subtilis]|uniref:Uncharacterized protein n=1 Tax=Bacillus subtilis TaxID=1423 RepID=A0A0D1INV2_BACIU|nr:hypothetical protein B4143_0320 [Bacillus subtilis]KIU10973.1 hypothetical protein SC09_Contig25orf00877 [Bacillus subtilis]RAP04954.1 hypothetical protein HS3_03632 [Bacillus subtilis]RPK08025.1 hypothetical protein EH5_04120 [Bacillus subtilis]
MYNISAGILILRRKKALKPSAFIVFPADSSMEGSFSV